MAVDITFWIIQALLLTPVLFMAASVGTEERPSRGAVPVLPPSRERPEEEKEDGDGQDASEPVTAPSVVAAAVASLSQFTAEQQAHLVLLRSFVQEARSGRGALSDDLAAAPAEVPARAMESAPQRHKRAGWRPRLNNQQLMLVGGVLCMVLGVVGVVRTSLAMDDLQRSSVSPTDALTPAAKFLPGVIVNPAKYLSAVNGGSGSGNSRVDLLYAVSQMDQKQAMDRWEALVGIGLSLLLFANAMRGSEEESSMAFDVAPFVLVAAVLFAGLSFFELP